MIGAETRDVGNQKKARNTAGALWLEDARRKATIFQGGEIHRTYVTWGWERKRHNSKESAEILVTVMSSADSATPFTLASSPRRLVMAKLGLGSSFTSIPRRLKNSTIAEFSSRGFVPS